MLVLVYVLGTMVVLLPSTYLPSTDIPVFHSLFLYFEWEVYIIKYVMYKKPLNPANMHHEIRASFGFWLAS